MVSEMERTLAGLNRQAKKAERYKKYRAEQTDLELHTASLQFLKLRAETVVLQTRLADRQQRLEEAKHTLAASETRLQSLRVEEANARSALDIETAAGYEIENDLKVAETEIRHLNEEIRRYLHEAQSAKDLLSTAAEQERQMEEEKHLLVEQIERVERELTGAGERFTELSTEHEEARNRLKRKEI